MMCLRVKLTGMERYVLVLKSVPDTTLDITVVSVFLTTVSKKLGLKMSAMSVKLMKATAVDAEAEENISFVKFHSKL